jgi:hypothetical protein
MYCQRVPDAPLSQYTVDSDCYHPCMQCCGSGSTGSTYFPGSGFGSISQRHGSGSRCGSGSFYHQAKKIRKTLIPTALWLLFDFFIFENDVRVPSRRNNQKNLLKNYFFVVMKSSNSTALPVTCATCGRPHQAGSFRVSNTELSSSFIHWKKGRIRQIWFRLIK